MANKKIWLEILDKENEFFGIQYALESFNYSAARTIFYIRTLVLETEILPEVSKETISGKIFLPLNTSFDWYYCSLIRNIQLPDVRVVQKSSEKKNCISLIFQSFDCLPSIDLPMGTYQFRAEAVIFTIPPDPIKLDPYRYIKHLISNFNNAANIS